MACEARHEKIYKKSIVNSGILSVCHSLRNTALLASFRVALPEDEESIAQVIQSIHRGSEIKSGSAKLQWTGGAQRPILHVNKHKIRARSAANTHQKNIKIMYLKPEGSSELREQAFQHLPTRPCTEYN